MFSKSFKTQVFWPNQKLRCHPIFALDSEHILLEELFKTKTSSLGPWLHPSTKWFWFSSKWQGEVIKNFGFQLWDPRQMNSVRGYIHVWYATLGVYDLRFMRYVLLKSRTHPTTHPTTQTFFSLYLSHFSSEWTEIWHDDSCQVSVHSNEKCQVSVHSNEKWLRYRGKTDWLT